MNIDKDSTSLRHSISVGLLVSILIPTAAVYILQEKYSEIGIYLEIISILIIIFIFTLVTKDKVIDLSSKISNERFKNMPEEEVLANLIKMEIGVVGLFLSAFFGFLFNDFAPNLIVITSTISIGLIAEFHNAEIDARGKWSICDWIIFVIFLFFTIIFIFVPPNQKPIESNIYFIHYCMSVSAGFTVSTILIESSKSIRRYIIK